MLCHILTAMAAWQAKRAPTILELGSEGQGVHRADTNVNTDYFSLFTFNNINNMWK